MLELNYWGFIFALILKVEPETDLRQRVEEWMASRRGSPWENPKIKISDVCYSQSYKTLSSGVRMSEEQSRKNTLWNQKDLKNSILRVGSQIIYIIPNCDIHYVSTEIYPVWNVSVVLNKSKQYDRTGQWTSSGTVFFGQSKALELALGQQLAFWTPLPLFHQTCFHIIWKSVLKPSRHNFLWNQMQSLLL